MPLAAPRTMKIASTSSVPPSPMSLPRWYGVIRSLLNARRSFGMPVIS
jgi:hypothetical protein